MKIISVLFCVLVVINPLICQDKSAGLRTFTNPIFSSGADPWIIQKDGYFYYTNTSGSRLNLRKAKNLDDLKVSVQKTIWIPPAGTSYSKELWAPELHFIKGKWYMYFAADDGSNKNHRMYVVENPSPDPMEGSWGFKGKISDPSDKWAIDGSVFEYKDKLYMIWSGWEGDADGQQNIYIARMKDPWTIESERVRISAPEYDWEKIGDLNREEAPHVNVNEGPVILRNGEKLFLIYSASGCWTDSYCLGMLIFTGKDNLLDPSVWKKNPLPVFKQKPESGVFAPGHNSFFKSPDGKEDWILYHANSAPGQGCGKFRSPRAQKFTWNKNGTPDFGEPLSSDLPLAIPSEGSAINPFAKWTKTELVLDNGIIKRTIQLPSIEGNFMTTSYKPVNGDFNYFQKTVTDFQFEVNNVIYSGKGKWNLKSVQSKTDSKEGNGAAVTLISQDKKVELTLKYLLYPNSPAIRKCLIVNNLTDKPVSLESVDIEKFEVPAYYPVTFSWIYHDYGRRRSIGPFEGGSQDALVIVHDMNTEQGIVLGNEATGVMKHTSVFWDAQDICVGMTHKNARFPFRKWIAPGGSFETPGVFTMVYNNQKTPDEILNTAVPDYVRKYMGIRLSELKEKPTFVYNTWEPFGKEINEKLVMELAKAAADAGMKEFIIDDGWQDSYGDWGIDKNKFPNGLKPVFDYIKSLGMKPGLWVSIGSASPDSKVYQAHPEWFVLDKNGKVTSLHVPGDTGKFTACFGTGWYDYIKDILMKLSVDYGLEYFKLDFAVVTSAYTYDKEQSGCYSANHPGHIDHNESLYTNYERLWQLFDELHAATPKLFIDCTFETLGGVQLIDYALLKHAEGDWLSNFEGIEGEKTDIRIRNMAWWRSPAIPATALVIGNPQMQDKDWEMHIKSIAGALPIMLGDPRKLSLSDLGKYRGYADWLQLMETKYGIMSFRQDLPGLGEPMEGMWDGFQRINTDTEKGGIIGIFRHGSVETKRIITVNYLDQTKTYYVKSMSGKEVTRLTGKELKTIGFAVNLNSYYSGELFEISE